MLPAPPDSHLKSFTQHNLDGVRVYLPRGLILDAPALLLRAQGFWKFRWLTIQGVAAPAACGI